MAAQAHTINTSRRTLLTAGAAAIVGGSLAGAARALSAPTRDAEAFLREARELGCDFWLVRRNGREELNGVSPAYRHKSISPEEWDRRFHRVNALRQRPGFDHQLRNALVREGSVYEIPAA